VSVFYGFRVKTLLAISRPQELLTNLHGKQNGHRLRSDLPRTLTKPYVVSGRAKTYCPPSEVGFDSWVVVYKAACYSYLAPRKQELKRQSILT
jgi:hypothetical protein